MSRLATFAAPLLVLTLLPGCFPPIDGVRPDPVAADAGTIAFASAAVGGNAAATEQARRNVVSQLAILLR